MRYFLVFIFAFCLLGARAQNSSTLNKELQIGDTLPNVLLNQIINDTVSSAKLFDYKGKILIIDFWSTSCVNCIEFLPEVVKLNKELKDVARILPVTTQSRDLIQKFLKANLYLKPYHVPTVVGDQVLSGLFPHKFMPYDVWIGGDGKVLGFTMAAGVSKDIILQVAAGAPLPNPKGALIKRFANDKLLFLADSENLPPNVQSSSTILGEYPGFEPGQFEKIDSARHLKRITWINQPYLNLFSQAYSNDGLVYFPTRRLVAANDRIPVNAWQADRVLSPSFPISFEVLVSDRLSSVKTLQSVIEQLNAQWGVDCRIDSVLTDCWVLTKVRDVKFPKVKRTQQIDPDKRSLHWMNSDAEDIAYRMNMVDGAVPVINETGTKATFNLILKAWPKAQDIESWNAEFASLGFKLNKSRMRLKMLVISPRDIANQNITFNHH